MITADSVSEKSVHEAYESFARAARGELSENGTPEFGDAAAQLIPMMDGSTGAEAGISEWMSAFFAAAANGILTVFEAVSPVFALVILSSAAKAVIPSEGIMGRSFDGFASLLCGIEVFGITSAVLSCAQNYLDGLCGIMNFFVPVIEAVCLMSGSITEKAVSGGGMVLIITVAGNFSSKILAPSVKLLFAMSMIVCACPSSRLSGVVSAFGKFIGRVWSVFGIIFSFLLSSQTILARAADSLGARTVRFAAGSFVPAAGGMLAEAFSTVRAGMSYIRQASGIGGIVVLMTMFLSAVIPLFMYRIAVSASAAAAEMLGASDAAAILGEARGTVEMIIGVVIAASLLFFLALTMFMKIQGG